MFVYLTGLELVRDLPAFSLWRQAVNFQNVAAPFILQFNPQPGLISFCLSEDFPVIGSSAQNRLHFYFPTCLKRVYPETIEMIKCLLYLHVSASFSPCLQLTCPAPVSTATQLSLLFPHLYLPPFLLSSLPNLWSASLFPVQGWGIIYIL